MILRVPVEIKASPEKIYAWCTNFEENFKKWHPHNVACTWIEGEPMKVGSVLYIEEHRTAGLNSHICSPCLLPHLTVHSL
ncbi:MAG: SRPBCC family protein [Theionarchaea archaeon]|nr:SRPBCC family protein [Theionarchaea archaeon]